MTLLTIAQHVATEAGFASPSTVVGNSDDTALLLLTLINRAGKILAQKPWQALQKEYTFSLVASQASYAFPTDYGYFEDYTLWNRTNFWALYGSLSPQTWQAYKSGVQSTTPLQRFRVKQGAIYIDPTPSTTDTMAIEYVSNRWVFDGVSTYATSFTADTQTSLIPEEVLEMDVLWRFLSRKGLAYAEDKDQSDRHLESLFGNDVPHMPINLGGCDAEWPPLPTLPVTGYS